MEKKKSWRKKNVSLGFCSPGGKKVWDGKKQNSEKKRFLFAHGGGRGGQWQKLLLCQNWKEAKD